MNGYEWTGMCGGESGHHARMMEPDWARDLALQCKQAQTAFHMKQMTGGHNVPIPDDLMIRELPELAD